MKKIISILLMATSVLLAQYTKEGDTLKELSYHLQWQDDSSVRAQTYSWMDAINVCENLTLDGYDDWRLPNVIELRTILDRSKDEPAIDEDFTNKEASKYWTSTSYVYNTAKVWSINFSHGSVSVSTKTESQYVRCVRDF